MQTRSEDTSRPLTVLSNAASSLESEFNSRGSSARPGMTRQSSNLVKERPADSFMGSAASTPAKTRRYMDDDDDEEEDYIPREQVASGRSSAVKSPSTRRNRLSYDDNSDDEAPVQHDDGEDGWEGPVRRGSAEASRQRAREREEAVLRAMDVGRQLSPSPLSLTNMREFLTTPIPKSAGTVLCYIRRNKSGTHRLFPVYSLWLKDGDRFLLQSKKRSNNKTSNYIVCMGSSPADLDKNSPTYLGKLRSNFMGTEFQVFDHGLSPSDNMATGDPSRVRKELAGITYAANVLGSRGPRKMQVAVPRVDEEGRVAARPAAAQEDILVRMRDRNMRDLQFLINKPPRWNEQIGAYVLNFNGRVTMASVKNFQLVDPDEQNAVVLQFGRVAKDEFTMDMQWPLSPLQAFGITLSSFDSKIACD